MAKRKSGLSAPAKRTLKSKRSTSEDIDYSDIPKLTAEQMKRMRRVGRPSFGEVSKQMIALRLEPRVIEMLKRVAGKEGIGYQTLINRILEEFLTQKKPA